MTARRTDSRSLALSARGKRWLAVSWYRARVAICSLRWWLRTGVFFIAFIVLGSPLYREALSLGLLHTALAVLLTLTKAFAASSDRTMKVVEGQYLERKLLLHRLIRDLQRREAMTPEEKLRYQCETLQLIASYVRSHRADLEGNEIYANLLVKEGSDLVVVARDREHRFPGARYPERLMAAGEVLRTGEAHVVGHVGREYGDVEKPYRALLLLPVRSATAVIAVVSIDSSRAYHFDLEARDLDRYLRPYLALLEWTV